MVRNIYFVVLLVLFYKQSAFLVDNWKKFYNENHTKDTSVIHYVNKIEEINFIEKCDTAVNFYTGLPKEYGDFWTDLLTKYALSPCRVHLMWRNNYTSSSGYSFIHKSHHDFDRLRKQKHNVIAETNEYLLFFEKRR